MNSNIIFNQLKESIEEQRKVENIPAGYIRIKLSTKGKLGAPAVFHIRNFKVRDMFSLSSASEKDAASKLINILNNMIYEDVDVSTWHEKEVEELMIYLYGSFYSKVLENIPYNVTEKDKEFLKSQGEFGEETLRDIENGKYKPVFSIDLFKDLDTYDISDDFKSSIKITNKETGFNVTFGYIKYGDRLIIKRWLDKKYKNEELKFTKIRSQIEFNNNLILNNGNLDNLIPLNKDEEKEYTDYLDKYLEDATEVSKLISIVDYNGQDIRNMSLDAKYEKLANDPQIDYGMIAKLTARQNKNPFGVKPFVNITNPITGEKEERRFSFRIPDVIQALQLPRVDRYDDGYDDEN